MKRRSPRNQKQQPAQVQRGEQGENNGGKAGGSHEYSASYIASSSDHESEVSALSPSRLLELEDVDDGGVNAGNDSSNSLQDSSKS